MKRIVRNNGQTGNSSALPSGQEGPTFKFDHLLEWARLGSAHVRKNTNCANQHRQNLSASGESKKRLIEFIYWRKSPAFSETEKAVLMLSEIISLRGAKKLSPKILKDAGRHFSTEEIVRLTLTITAVNDWIDLHDQREKSERQVFNPSFHR